jgi:hypothetical protein
MHLLPVGEVTNIFVGRISLMFVFMTGKSVCTFSKMFHKRLVCTVADKLRNEDVDSLKEAARSNDVVEKHLL